MSRHRRIVALYGPPRSPRAYTRRRGKREGPALAERRRIRRVRRAGVRGRRALLAPLVAWLVSAPADAQIAFRDATADAGLAGAVQHAATPPEDCLFGPFVCPERMTGGAAADDVDGDGDVDVFLPVLDGPDRLFANQGDGTFVDVSAAAGFAAFDTQSNGAAFADLDNDGDADLYVTVLGAAGDPGNDRHLLFVNAGNGTFSEEGTARGAALASPNARLGFGVATGDYDRDGWLDLFVAEWRPGGIGNGAPDHARLLRNLGPEAPGHFEDWTEAAGIELPGRVSEPDAVFAFAPAFVDLDGDGWQDLALASDFGTSRLFWNRGDGTFRDGTAAAGVGGDENGMGSTLGDADGDGDLDWFVTSIFDPDETCESESCDWGYTGNRLYRNDGARRFADATDAFGVRDGAWGWGTAFFDPDLDGDLDLVMTNGVDFPGDTDAPFEADAMRLWRNDGAGPWKETAAAAGIADTGSGKALVVLDADGDGDPDVLVANNAAPPVLFENTGADGSGNGWLRVRAPGSLANRDGRGAVVQVTAGGATQVREIGAGGHFLGHGPPVAHFGLGPGSGPVEELRVRWPNGRIAVLHDVARNQAIVVPEPDTDPCDDGFDNDGDGRTDHPADPGCDAPDDFTETSAALPCDDDLDGDGDGRTDHPADPGCDAPDDPSERSPALPCDDGVDGDGDGLVDHPGDPGCLDPLWPLEDPACQDGVDNDGALGIDFDGGASLNGGTPVAWFDPECLGRPWRHSERPASGGCGLGAELAPVAAALAALRRRRRRQG